MGSGAFARSAPDAGARPTVLLIYDVHPQWQPEEQDLASRQGRRLGIAIRRQGHTVHMLEVRDPQLPETLAGFDREQVVVFNWCERFPGQESSEADVIDVLDRLGDRAG